MSPATLTEATRREGKVRGTRALTGITQGEGSELGEVSTCRGVAVDLAGAEEGNGAIAAPE